VFPHPAAAPDMRASEILSKDEVSLKAAKSGYSATVKNKSTAPARLSFTSRGDVTIGLRGTNHHLDFARGRRDGLFFLPLIRTCTLVAGLQHCRQFAIGSARQPYETFESRIGYSSSAGGSGSSFSIPPYSGAAHWRPLFLTNSLPFAVSPLAGGFALSSRGCRTMEKNHSTVWACQTGGEKFTFASHPECCVSQVTPQSDRGRIARLVA
jgi:hypothetical protein